MANKPWTKRQPGSSSTQRFQAATNCGDDCKCSGLLDPYLREIASSARKFKGTAHGMLAMSYSRCSGPYGRTLLAAPSSPERIRDCRGNTHGPRKVRRAACTCVRAAAETGEGACTNLGRDALNFSPETSFTKALLRSWTILSRHVLNMDTGRKRPARGACLPCRALCCSSRSGAGDIYHTVASRQRAP